jgi:hypothetical protein
MLDRRLRPDNAPHFAARDAKKERAIRTALAAGGKGLLKIAAEFGVGLGTVQRIKAAMAAS